MRYPESLVQEFGAKAGLLQYVNECLPHIPQMPYVVRKPGIPIESVVATADASGIGWPRVYRPSAVEELWGLEGAIPSMFDEGFVLGNATGAAQYRTTQAADAYRQGCIENIATWADGRRNNPQLKDVPDEICVIIAEHSPSKYAGTLIKHPNRDIILHSVCDTPFGKQSISRQHLAYVSGKKHTNLMSKWSSKHFFIDDHEKTELLNIQRQMNQELQQIASWHDAIANLPLMDAQWSYQLEFGLLPACLYQVRPFKERMTRTAHVSPPDDTTRHIVLGVTPPEGIRLRVERGLMRKEQETINPAAEPSVFVGDLRELISIGKLTNLQANMVFSSYGFLQHDDVAAMRRAQVSVLYLTQECNLEKLTDGEHILLRADGRNVAWSRVD